MQPRWHPGYAVAATTTLALVLTAPGQTMLISLLNLPLRETFGVEPLVLNGAYTAATLAAAWPLVWVGRMTDRVGPRKMLTILGACFGGACLFTAAIDHVVMIFCAFFLLRLLGPGAVAMVSHHALAMWFHRRLGTVSGIQLVALFGAWAALPTWTTRWIDAYGWRITWAAFGVVIAVTLSAVSWRFVRDRPEELGLSVDGDSFPRTDRADSPDEPGFTLEQAKATRSFWILAIASLLPPMIGTALLFDIQPMFVGRGLDPADSAFAVSAWSATMAFMALPSGRLVDRVAPRWLILTGTVGLGTSCALWLWAATTPVATAAVVMYGVAQSLVSPTVGATAARFFGRRHHGAIRSSYARVGIIATGLGPLVFGISHHLSGGYDGALIVFIALCVPAGMASWTLASPAVGDLGPPRGFNRSSARSRP